MRNIRHAVLPPLPAGKSARDVLVVQTFVVDGPKGTGVSHYQLHFAPDDAPDARELILLTRDHALYRRALNAENTPQRFDITWHPSKRPDGTLCARLDSMTERKEPADDDDCES